MQWCPLPTFCALQTAGAIGPAINNPSSSLVEDGQRQQEEPDGEVAARVPAAAGGGGEVGQQGLDTWIASTWLDLQNGLEASQARTPRAGGVKCTEGGRLCARLWQLHMA